MKGSSMNNIRHYAYTCYQLLRTDLIELRKTFFDQALNLGIWVFCTLVVMGYLTKTQFHITASDFGVFNLAGCIASAGLFEVYPRSFSFIADLEGPQIISYYTTLPVPPVYVFLTKMLYWLINTLLRGLILLPLGKLVLWNSFPLADVHWLKFLIIFLIGNLFYSALTLFVASIIPSMAQMENVWMRYIFPLWFLGGFQFSWYNLHKLSPMLAYVNLLNPVVYVMEGTRSALLGQGNNLPFWFCVIMLIIFSLLCVYIGIKRTKKRLDCV